MNAPGTGCSFPERLRALASTDPDRRLITVWSRDGEHVTTAADLWDETLAVATTLKHHGAGPGALVMVAARNAASFYAKVHAAWLLGATVLPYDASLPVRAVADIRRTAAGRWTDVVQMSDHDELASATTHAALDHIKVADPGWAFLSGGSSGTPKLIVNDGRHVATPTSGPLPGVPGMVGMRTGQVQLVAGPLFHGAPASWSTLGVFHGHSLVVMAQFDADAAVDLIHRHRVQWAFLVPTMMRRILRVDGLRPERLRSLEAICHASAPCPPAVKRGWIDLVGADRVHEGFGGTEAAGATVISGDDWLERPGSVGLPVPGWEAAVLDDDGVPVPQGEIGLIHFRPDDGPAPFSYVGADRRVTDDRWVTLGDLGRMDEDGYLYVADRRSDLVITGGANVYPAEVEGVLLEHHDVADAVVVGAADTDLGQRVVALVVARDPAAPPTADVLLGHCAERLARYKVPRDVRFVPSLPRNEQGKLQRRALWDTPFNTAATSPQE